MSLTGIVSGPFCHACRKQFERGERHVADQDRVYHARCLEDVRAAGGIAEYRIAEPTDRERKLERDLEAAEAALAVATENARSFEQGYKRQKRLADQWKQTAQRLQPRPAVAAPQPAPPPAAARPVLSLVPAPADPPPIGDGADGFRPIEPYEVPR